MWRITRKSGTLQQVLIMGAMNLLHTKLGKEVANQNGEPQRGQPLHSTAYVDRRRKTMQAA